MRQPRLRNRGRERVKAGHWYLLNEGSDNKHYKEGTLSSRKERNRRRTKYEVRFERGKKTDGEGERGKAEDRERKEVCEIKEGA